MNRVTTPIKMVTVFLLVLGVYLKTLCPSVYVGDSGELIVAAKLLGVAHPTSYPLYVLMGKVFTFLPLASPAFLVNFFSAVVAALSVVVFALVLEKLLTNQILALAGSLLFAFSLTFWSQAVISRVYCLNVLFFCLVLYFLLSPKDRYLKFLFWGGGAANHYFIWLLAPLLLINLVKNRKRIKFKEIILICFVLILGISMYIKLPMRAVKKPSLNWHDPKNVSSLFDNVLQRTYRHKMASRNAGDILWLGYSLLLSFGPEYFYFGTVFMFLGIYYLFKRDKWFFIGLILIVGGNFCLISFYGTPRELHLLYFLPTFLTLGLLLVSGMQQLIFVVSPNFKKFVLLLTLPLIVLQVYLNYYSNDRRWHFLLYDFGYNILNSLPKDALLYSLGDNKIFIMAYQTMVEIRRPDILIGGVEEGAMPDSRVTNYQLRYGFRSDVFYTYFRHLIARGQDAKKEFIPAGLVWQQVKPSAELQSIVDPYQFNRYRELGKVYNLDTKSKYINTYYNLNEANRLMVMGRKKMALSHIINAYKNSGRDEDGLFQAGRLLMQLNEVEWAYKVFYKISIINPRHKANLQNLAAMAQLSGKHSEAISYYQKILRIDKNYYRAMYNLGNLYTQDRKIQLARLHFNNFLASAPPHEAKLINEVKAILRNLPAE